MIYVKSRENIVCVCVSYDDVLLELSPAIYRPYLWCLPWPLYPHYWLASYANTRGFLSESVRDKYFVGNFYNGISSQNDGVTVETAWDSSSREMPFFSAVSVFELDNKLQSGNERTRNT